MRLGAAWLLPVVALCGCANLLSWDAPARRETHNQAAAPVVPERPVGANEYMVRPGDTMYSIAFRHQLDYRELAKWNGIGSGFLIRPGQVLRLAQPPRVALIEGDIVSHPEEDAAPRASARPIALPTESIGVPPPPLGQAPSAPARPGARPVPVPPVVVATAPPAVPAPTSLPPPIITSESGGPYRWQWPVDGVVVRGYNLGAGSKGLDFSGAIGQPVYAAAPGKVVYSGSALKGYGELIIIKHDDLRLSAYGYNRRRLVNEGQMVKGGQAIAELGLGPENRPILHFEIRERGQPVDPVPYLPARSASR
jgi:lipoprotein NlpD